MFLKNMNRTIKKARGRPLYRVPREDWMRVKAAAFWLGITVPVVPTGKPGAGRRDSLGTGE